MIVSAIPKPSSRPALRRAPVYLLIVVASAVSAKPRKLCRCGCGRDAIASRDDGAVLLAASRRNVEELRAKLASGGPRKAKAQHLLWTWDQRCEKQLDAWVHGFRPSRYYGVHTAASLLGAPTPAFLDEWRSRAENL